MNGKIMVGRYNAGLLKWLKIALNFRWVFTALKQPTPNGCQFTLSLGGGLQVSYGSGMLWM
jgi:hypothetical protein